MKDTKYHEGDLVVVRPDLDLKCCYWMRSGVKEDAPWRNVSDVVTEDMMEYCGQAIKIEGLVDTVDGKKYRAKGRYWTDDMFSGPAGSECYCESLL